MALSAQAREIVSEFSAQKPKLGDIKKRAKAIKKNHELAVELWATGGHFPRLLATLIFDKKLLTEESIENTTPSVNLASLSSGLYPGTCSNGSPSLRATTQGIPPR